MFAVLGDFNLEIDYEFLGLGHFDWSRDVEFSCWLVFCEPEVIHFEAASYKIIIENYQINIDQIIVAKNIFAPVGGCPEWGHELLRDYFPELSILPNYSYSTNELASISIGSLKIHFLQRPGNTEPQSCIPCDFRFNLASFNWIIHGPGLKFQHQIRLDNDIYLFHSTLGFRYLEANGKLLGPGQMVCTTPDGNASGPVDLLKIATCIKLNRMRYISCAHQPLANRYIITAARSRCLSKTLAIAQAIEKNTTSCAGLNWRLANHIHVLFFVSSCRTRVLVVIYKIQTAGRRQLVGLYYIYFTGSEKLLADCFFVANIGHWHSRANGTGAAARINAVAEPGRHGFRLSSSSSYEFIDGTTRSAKAHEIHGSQTKRGNDLTSSRSRVSRRFNRQLRDIAAVIIALTMIAYAKPLNPVYPKDPVTTPIESSQPDPSDQPGSPLISNLTPDQSFQLSALPSHLTDWMVFAPGDLVVDSCLDCAISGMNSESGFFKTAIQVQPNEPIPSDQPESGLISNRTPDEPFQHSVLPSRLSGRTASASSISVDNSCLDCAITGMNSESEFFKTELQVQPSEPIPSNQPESDLISNRTPFESASPRLDGVPGPLPVVGLAMFWGWSRRCRHRLRRSLLG
jgi:hypothetical protein